MGANERIMVADDNDLVRRMLKRNLEANGYVVVAEANSVDATKALVDNSEVDFTLAIVDARMPDAGDGEEVFGYIREKRPGVKVMSFSGELQGWGDLRMTKDTSLREMCEAIGRI